LCLYHTSLLREKYNACSKLKDSIRGLQNHTFVLLEYAATKFPERLALINYESRKHFGEHECTTLYGCVLVISNSQANHPMKGNFIRTIITFMH
jgi:hypothetical protein